MEVWFRWFFLVNWVILYVLFCRFSGVLFLLTPPQKTNQCTLKRGHFKRKVIFHPPIFGGHVSFRWSKLPSLPLFAQLVCVWFLFIIVSWEDMILFAQKGSQQAVFVSSIPLLAGFALSSLLFWVLSQHCGAWNYMLLFFQVFLVMFIQFIQTTFI